MLLVDLIVLGLALVIHNAIRGQSSDSFVPSGITNVVDALIEFWDNAVRKTLGEKASRVLPLVITVFLFILVATLLKLVPGTENVGLMTCAESGQPGYPRKDFMGIDALYVTGDLNQRAGVKATDADFLACVRKYPQYRPPNSETEIATEDGNGNSELFNIVPFFRGLSTDINMPLAIAIIVWVTVETLGVREHGWSYFLRYFNVKALWNIRKNPIGIVLFFVSLIELVSCLSRLLTLSVRLVGVTFAGTVLMAVMVYLVPLGLPVIFIVFEIVMGVIQAYVFGILTITYTNMALSHND